jgi:hypothetical protein
MHQMRLSHYLEDHRTVICAIMLLNGRLAANQESAATQPIIGVNSF